VTTFTRLPTWSIDAQADGVTDRPCSFASMPPSSPTFSSATTNRSWRKSPR